VYELARVERGVLIWGGHGVILSTYCLWISKGRSAITASTNTEISGWIPAPLDPASPDLLCSMVQWLAEALMSSDAAGVGCGVCT
jgi:hypothetical protein